MLSNLLIVRQLLGQVVPLELCKVLYRPDVIMIQVVSFLSSNLSPVECDRTHLRFTFVSELDPALLILQFVIATISLS